MSHTNRAVQNTKCVDMGSLETFFPIHTQYLIQVAIAESVIVI